MSALNKVAQDTRQDDIYKNIVLVLNISEKFNLVSVLRESL